MRGGFTLIELVVVIIITSILSLAAYPLFKGSAGMGLGAAAEIVKSDIRHTQAVAMTSGEAKSIVFTGGKSSYAYSAGEGGSETRDLNSISGGVAVASNETITFNTLGEPVGGGASIVLTMKGGSVTVTVEPYTGKTMIE